MSKFCKEDYSDEKGYSLFLSIISKQKDEEYISYLQGLNEMSKSQRLEYRNTLSENGTELTPSQLDKKLLIIEYALNYIYS